MNIQNRVRAHGKPITHHFTRRAGSAVRTPCTHTLMLEFLKGHASSEVSGGFAYGLQLGTAAWAFRWVNRRRQACAEWLAARFQYLRHHSERFPEIDVFRCLLDEEIDDVVVQDQLDRNRSRRRLALPELASNFIVASGRNDFGVTLDSDALALLGKPPLAAELKSMTRPRRAARVLGLLD